MKVELSIKGDRELRNTIKDMIKGQILAITREEIDNTIKSEIKRKIEKEHFSTFVIKSLIKSTVTQISRNALLEIKENATKELVEYSKDKISGLAIQETKRIIANIGKSTIEKHMIEKISTIPMEISFKKE